MAKISQKRRTKSREIPRFGEKLSYDLGNVFVLALMLVLALGAWLMFDSLIMESFRYELRSAVEVMADNVNQLQDEANAGVIAQEQARALAIDLVQNGTWGEGRRGFWALGHDGTLLAKVENGDLPQKPGENVWEWQDADGVYVQQELIQAGQRGGDFVKFRVANSRVDNSYIGYSLDTEMGFVGDATFDLDYFEEYSLQYTREAVPKFTLMLVATLGVMVPGYFVVRQIVRQLKKPNRSKK